MRSHALTAIAASMELHTKIKLSSAWQRAILAKKLGHRCQRHVTNLPRKKRNHLQQAMPWIFVPTPMLACRRPRASRHPQGKLSKLERFQTHHNMNRNEQTMLFGCSTREKFNTQAMPRIRYKVQNDSNVLPERFRCSTRYLSHLRPSTLTLRPSNEYAFFSPEC